MNESPWRSHSEKPVFFRLDKSESLQLVSYKSLAKCNLGALRGTCRTGFRATSTPLLSSAFPPLMEPWRHHNRPNQFQLSVKQFHRLHEQDTGNAKETIFIVRADYCLHSPLRATTTDSTLNANHFSERARTQKGNFHTHNQSCRALSFKVFIHFV
jgi:hypothetical protein